MKVFVTGGTGFIGSHLVDMLLQDDQVEEVRCLIRNKKKWLKNKPIVPYQGNLQSLPTLKSAMDGVDLVYHLAAVTHAPNPKHFEVHNVDATENIVRTALKKGIKNIVILSSLAAAGPSFSRPLDESDPLMPISSYGKSKKRMEEVVRQVTQNNPELSIKILRPPAVYGPRDEDIFAFFKIASKGICPVASNEENTESNISLMFVKDVIQALQKAASMGEKGTHTYFIAGPGDYTWKEIANVTGRVLGRKVVTLPISPKWLKRFGAVVERTGAILGTYPAFNTEKANEMVMQWTCNIHKAKVELGYTPQYSLERGISATINWYKKHHWL